jgi:Rrf2 family transcriptional regulator, nitric oxide-sensitive transcriptional repressor
MKLNDFTDYTLRTLMYLAVTDETTVTAQTVSDRFDISFHHVAKVAQWLARNGYVKAVRGRRGGMSLALPPGEISIGAVVRAAEKGTAMVECMKPGPVSCKVAPACFLEPAIREAQEAFYASLDRKTLADITGNHLHLQKLLQIG